MVCLPTASSDKKAKMWSPDSKLLLSCLLSREPFLALPLSRVPPWLVSPSVRRESASFAFIIVGASNQNSGPAVSF